MTTFQIVGLVIFVGGMVPYAIGSLIHISHHPEALDLRFRMTPWPSWPYGWPRPIHPKARWWCGIGFPISIAGFVLLVVSTFSLGFLALFIAFGAVFFGVIRFIGKKRQ